MKRFQLPQAEKLVVGVAGLCLAALSVALTAGAKSKQIELEVGIVQRFGSEVTDKLIVTPTAGDTLNLRFGHRTLKTKQLELEIELAALPQATVAERLVLSDHATFETAEDSAKKWQERGIAVEVTQPGRWQVWAKRDVYPTPLLRRLLLESLEAQGYNQVYLETEILKALPQIAFTLEGQRYELFGYPQSKPEELTITTGKERVQVQQGEQVLIYPGNLKVQANAYNNYTVVNKVELEDYLRGVVPFEIGPNAPANAAEAQAIIARTYALRNLRRFAADNYELCATTHCQVYKGLSGANSRSDRAIAATKNLVLTYNNQLVDALYSATTGGVTARFGDIWNGEDRPYLQAVIDSPNQVWDLEKNSLAEEINLRRFLSLEQGFNETGRNVFRWHKASSIQQLSQDLGKYLKRTKHPLADFTKIEKMTITERSPSGRILKLEVKTDKGVVELLKTEVRSAFGPPISTLFYLEEQLNPDGSLKGYAFVGGGFGHGVGLSQYGSYNLARLGWSAEKILSFYYPGSKLQPLNDEIVFYSMDKEQ